MMRRVVQIMIAICTLFWIGCGTATEVPAPTKEDIHSHKDIHSEMEFLFPEMIGDLKWHRSDGVTFFD